jgi:hypothetical protein
MLTGDCRCFLPIAFNLLNNKKVEIFLALPESKKTLLKPYYLISSPVTFKKGTFKIRPGKG